MMWKRIVATFLTLLFVPVAGMGEVFETVTEPSEVYRAGGTIAIQRPACEMIPEAWNEGARADDAISVYFEGTLHDFKKTEARKWLVTAPTWEMDSMLSTFGGAAEAWQMVEDAPDGTVLYARGNEIVLAENGLGRIRYERDGMEWMELPVFGLSFLDAYEVDGKPLQSSAYTSQEALERTALDVLQCVQSDAMPMLVDAWSLSRSTEGRLQQLEMYAFALTYEGIPAALHDWQSPSEDSMVPAQELVFGYDENGLACLYMSTLHFEPYGDAKPIVIEPAVTRIRSGENLFVFAEKVDISLILLQYVPTASEAEGWLFVPCWCMSDYCERISASWFLDACCAYYMAIEDD